MNGSAPVVDEERRAAASELLRHLDHPARLRTNRLARLHATAAGDASGAVDGAVLRNLVRGAFERLTPTQRAIVERCDMGGELHRVVASDLAITERHFYRLRRAALAEIGRVLEAPAPRVERISEPAAPAQRALALATAFDQTGDRDAARDTLLRAAATETDPDERVRIEAALAQLAAESGDTSGALERLARVAHELAAHARADDALLERVALARANVLAASGDPSDSARLLTRDLVALRAAALTSPRLGVVEAYAAALLLAAEHEREVGAVDAALESVTLAKSILDGHNDASPLLRVDASLQIALLPVLRQPSAAAADALAAIGRTAMRFGLAQKSLMIEMEAAAIRRVSGDARAAIATMLPIVPMIRRVCDGRNRWIALLDVAASYTDAGDATSAHGLIRETIDAPGVDDNVSAMAHLRLAEVELRVGRLRAALESAGIARETFSAQGNPRLAGAALRIEAEAELRRGDRRAATARIRAALDVLRDASYPQAWERAAGLFQRITGTAVS